MFIALIFCRRARLLSGQYGSLLWPHAAAVIIYIADGRSPVGRRFDHT